MKKLLERQRGFTLIELVVVIAILGVLAAVAVPLITSYLESAKERAYNSEREQMQAAVDAYYSSPDNTRWLGQRQYPMKGMDRTSSTLADLLDDGAQSSTDLDGDAIPHENPLGGTVGGSPVWLDDGDGIRSGATGTDEENHNGPASSSNAGWHVVAVERQTKTYYVDTRDYIIDMSKLVDAGLLSKNPSSASADDCDGCEGSYIWYVDANGKVRSLLATFPVAANTDYQSGVFP